VVEKDDFTPFPGISPANICVNTLNSEEFFDLWGGGAIALADKI